MNVLAVAVGDLDGVAGMVPADPPRQVAQVLLAGPTHAAPPFSAFNRDSP